MTSDLTQYNLKSTGEKFFIFDFFYSSNYFVQEMH